MMASFALRLTLFCFVGMFQYTYRIFVNNPPGFIRNKKFWAWVLIEVKGLLEVNVRESIKGVYLNKKIYTPGYY